MVIPASAQQDDDRLHLSGPALRPTLRAVETVLQYKTGTAGPLLTQTRPSRREFGTGIALVAMPVHPIFLTSNY